VSLPSATPAFPTSLLIGASAPRELEEPDSRRVGTSAGRDAGISGGRAGRPHAPAAGRGTGIPACRGTGCNAPRDRPMPRRFRGACVWSHPAEAGTMRHAANLQALSRESGMSACRRTVRPANASTRVRRELTPSPATRAPGLMPPSCVPPRTRVTELGEMAYPFSSCRPTSGRWRARG